MSRDRTARTRIRQLLAMSGPIIDPSGYATGVLKDAVGYSGSAVAFIQLIATMDREGEISREIRGKRTYKIEGLGVPPTPSSGALAPTEPASSTVTAISVPGQPTIEIDYKLLAQALIRELLVATAAATAPEDNTEVDHDRLKAERDEYTRRLELARAQLDELLGQPMSAPRGDDAVAGREK